MIKKLLNTLYADENIINFNEDSGDSVFSCNELVVLNTDLNNINLDHTNYDKDNSETIIHIRLLAWNTKFEKRKALQKIYVKN